MTRATRKALVDVYGTLLKAGWSERPIGPRSRQPRPSPRGRPGSTSRRWHARSSSCNDWASFEHCPPCLTDRPGRSRHGWAKTSAGKSARPSFSFQAFAWAALPQPSYSRTTRNAASERRAFADRGDLRLAGLHPLVPGHDQRLGLGISPPTEQGPSELAHRVEPRPVIGDSLLAEVPSIPAGRARRPTTSPDSAGSGRAGRDRRRGGRSAFSALRRRSTVRRRSGSASAHRPRDS